MTLNYYEPWNLLDQMNRAMRGSAFPAQIDNREDDAANVVTREWTPAVDIKEEEGRFVIHADIPGVERDAIDVTMEDGILTLKGERAHETEVERSNYRRMERIRGTFYRRFSLPDTADADQISAKFNNGVLEMVIPKQEKLQPRRIEVKQ